jgi:hypothetical protein
VTRPSLLSVVAGIAFLAISAVASASLPSNAAVSARLIDQDRLKAHLEFIASDELQGRDTPSLGLEIAANYIGSHLKQWGASPAGDGGTFYQSFTVPDRSGGQAKVRNVVALIPGTDPVLKNEHVVIGAHYDHVGLADSGEDRVFNGADDNGSGTVAMLEMVRALLTGPRPKRSTLFIWFAGEERGLWGAAHFAKNPTVPKESLVAMFNMDMIGRSYTPDMGQRFREVVSGPHEIFVIGSARMSDGLAKMVEDSNRGFLQLSYNKKFDDPNDRMRLFYRSDHYEFAKIGVPSVFFFDGLHPDYHKVVDEVARIDFDKLTKVAQTVLATAWAVADASERPKLDRPLPPR